MKRNFLYYMSVGLIGLMLMLIAYQNYQTFAPVTVIKAKVQPYKILNHRVKVGKETLPLIKVGDVLVYQVDACKYRDSLSLVTRRFVDGVSYTLPAESNNVPKGCRKTNVPVIVPNLPPGRWHMEIDVQYTINPQRTQTYHFRTENFIIRGK